MQKLYREVLNGTLDQTFSKGLSRREFLKLTAGVLGVYATSGITGCLNGSKEPPRTTPYRDRFKYGYRVVVMDEDNNIAGEAGEEDKRVVAALMENLKEYSPEWYEKTMWAAEDITLDEYDGGSLYGLILLEKGSAYDSVESGDVKRILSKNARFPHEVQHVIDQNLYERFKKIAFGKADEIDRLELELRAGIADDVYTMEIIRKKPDYYSHLDALVARWPTYTPEVHYYWRFKRFREDRAKVDQVKYKDRLDDIEEMYFDHENKKLKIDFLDESWQEFQRFLINE